MRERERQTDRDRDRDRERGRKAWKFSFVKQVGQESFFHIKNQGTRKTQDEFSNNKTRFSIAKGVQLLDLIKKLKIQVVE